MKRPIGIIFLVALLGWLAYSQRSMFFQSLAEEVRREFRSDSTAVSDVKPMVEPVSMPQDPVAASVSFKTGLSFQDRGVLDSATAYLELALKLDPANPEPYRHLAVVRARQEKPEAVLKALEGAIRQDSTDVWTWINLGKIQAQMGDDVSARKSWQQARVLDPENSAITDLLDITERDRQVPFTVDFPRESSADTAGANGQ